jgi:tubulin polyglutamylase TTLL6/13
MNVHESKETSKIIVNLMNTQYSLIKEVVQEIFCYRTMVNSGEEWDLMWTDTGVTVETFAKMKIYQKINHFPSMNCISRKDNLGKNLMRMRKYFPEEYNFFPLTWDLPNDLKGQLTQNKGKTYIVKPKAMNQDKGIYLIISAEELDAGEHCVVQRYITDPYLIEELKFDLRLYVLIYGCDPLRIYLYNEGLARLATEQYEQPSKYNIKNMYIQLTNYAINKHSGNFIFNTDEDETDTGHKRSLTSYGTT